MKNLLDIIFRYNLGKLVNIKRAILSNQRFYNVLHDTYFFKKYKHIVLNNILPKLDKIGLTKPISTKGDEVKIFIPFIETSIVPIFIWTLILKALQIRGAKIIFLICNRGIQKCERFSLTTPMGNCKYCSFMNENIIPRLGFELIEINDCITNNEKAEINKIAKSLSTQDISHYTYHGIDIMPVVEDSLMRYYYGAKPENSDQKFDYIVTALISTKVASFIHKKHEPDIVVSHMYAYSENHPYNLYYENLTDIPVYCIKSVPWNPNAIRINPDNLYRNEERYNQYLRSRTNKNITTYEKEELNKFLKKRFSGYDSEFLYFSYFEINGDEKKINTLNINKNKKNIFLFPNIEWDVGLTDCHIIFRDLMDWVEFTIESVKNRNDIHLYIKAHPGEIHGSSETQLTVAEKLLLKYPLLPNNVTIIPPDLGIMPYSLFKYIDVGIVLSGTLGLEMALNKIPVIATGFAPYLRKGFVHEPKDHKEYKNTLLMKNNSLSIDKNKLELFAYFYFIKTLIPFNLVEKCFGVTVENLNYQIDSITDLEPEKDIYLDHICDCILNKKIIESW